MMNIVLAFQIGSLLLIPGASALSMVSKEIFGIPNSGWTSPEWKWGFAQGTGHDCAKICRERYNTAKKRKELVQGLMDASCLVDFEEVKLVLALMLQRRRHPVYGQVLQNMAQAVRYELGDECECNRLLVKDMIDRFDSLRPTLQELEVMDRVVQEMEANNLIGARQICSGLVLNAMGFVEQGL